MTKSMLKKRQSTVYINIDLFLFISVPADEKM